MSNRLESKVAVITGAASGIGLATTELFVSEGALVVAVDFDNAAGMALQQRHGERVHFVHCDVTKLEQLRNAIDAAPRVFGGLDILFSNAGAGGSAAGLSNWDADGWDRTHDILLRSVAAGAAYAMPHMQARGGGAIVNTASVAALQAGYAPLAYSVAKAGVAHFTKVAAAELAPHHIRINAVAPGFIATQIFGRSVGMDAAAADAIAKQIVERSGAVNPLGSAGMPADIAEAVLYLASDASRFVTGVCLPVDGGITIGPRHSWDMKAPSPTAQILGFDRRALQSNTLPGQSKPD